MLALLTQGVKEWFLREAGGHRRTYEQISCRHRVADKSRMAPIMEKVTQSAQVMARWKTVIFSLSIEAVVTSDTAVRV
jgi:hypothetical protein